MLSSIICVGQTGNPKYDDPNFYYTLGNFEVQVEAGVSVGIIGYVRKTTILNEYDYQQQQQQNKLYEPNKYKYELILISTSTYQFESTSSWLYGVQIFVNGVDITAIDYPNKNYNLLIKTVPTMVYWRESSDEMVLMEIKWNNAIYDPRKVK